MLNAEELAAIKVGDRITFKALTRWSHKKATRKVNGFLGNEGEPTVRYGGCPEFIVHHREIIEVIPYEYGKEGK